ncbi:large conductance mechanosensitive channel protein MscL [Intestinibacillus massiliensis]|nr:large conductance mechanosensitive channel protein MscL [Intestinibacillus massiliensis]
MKKFLQEFKDFALRGNVMDLAVGVIIGAAFQAIVTSLTQDIISPVLGLFTGQNFDQLSVSLFGAELRYGAFITAVINFIIMALIIFLLVKGMNRLAALGRRKQHEEAPAAPATKVCPYCRSEIDIGATRCPHCTSQLSGLADDT